MITPGAEIIGIAAVEIHDGALYLRLRLSDGSVAACWWPLDALAACMDVILPATRAPAGARLQ